MFDHTWQFGEFRYLVEHTRMLYKLLFCVGAAAGPGPRVADGAAEGPASARRGHDQARRGGGDHQAAAPARRHRRAQAAGCLPLMLWQSVIPRKF